MKTEILETPEKAFKMNALNLQRTALEYGTVSLMQRADCQHHPDGTICADCERSAENLHYLSVALSVTSAAVAYGKQSELYDLLTRFAADNFDDFPKDLSKRGLYRTDGDFPDVIGDE